MPPRCRAIVFAALLTGCSGSDPARQVQSAHSWTATAILIGERWLNHSVRDGYSIDALKNASEELTKLAKTLQESMRDSSREKRSSITIPIQNGALHARQMASEVQSTNSPAFSVQLDSLRAAGRQLDRAAPREAQ